MRAHHAYHRIEIPLAYFVGSVVIAEAAAPRVVPGLRPAIWTAPVLHLVHFVAAALLLMWLARGPYLIFVNRNYLRSLD